MGPRTGHCASNPSTNIMTNMQTIVSGTAYSTGKLGKASHLGASAVVDRRIALVIALAFDNISTAVFLCRTLILSRLTLRPLP